jgi:hypothetical protein
MCNSCCPDRPFVSDEICGNFLTAAAAALTVYDTDGDVFPYGTVSVFYDRGNVASVTVTVTDSLGADDTFTVTRGNTISRTYNDIASVAITNTGGVAGSQANGKYCLTIHYQSV